MAVNKSETRPGTLYALKGMRINWNDSDAADLILFNGEYDCVFG